ncbi:MAG: AEC family transporter, partial [Oscillospiraceae bacterium]|nr:AEC family transporter [Oscillospiraceae bacterium]
KSILPSDTFSVLSKLETFVFLPALNLHNMMNNFTVETFKSNSSLILYGFICVLIVMVLSYPLSRLFVKKVENADEAYLRNIYKYALTFGNYGYLGNFIVLGIWGDEAFFKFSMFTFALNIVCNIWGLYILIPKEQNQGVIRNIIRGFSTPPMLSLLLGMVIGLFELNRFIPEFVFTTLVNAKSCMGPVAMLLAGVVIGGYNFKGLLYDKKVYAATFLRLIAIPAVMLLIMKLLGISDEIQTFTLIAFATPFGLNTIIFPATYGAETRTGASMAMISHIFSVLTIPLMYLVFIVLL